MTILSPVKNHDNLDFSNQLSANPNLYADFCSPPPLRDGVWSILKAANRVPVCSKAGAHSGIAAVEVEAARIGTANRTAPIDAKVTHKEERTIAVVAEARRRQL
jgi:hypothetical protein